MYATKLLMEIYKNLTALILSEDRRCEEAVESLHQALAFELAEAYMLEHGYCLDTHDNFIEKPETLIF